ncbi:GNAT family N-acetyltransferase [Erythrobacter ani]|uniref:GNAT family N-acetyltransferase n=1 Tax=Erythrobacter ani TaxID=2827235 RepID=A0ABS6SKQ1_9SPHN|nr:GNAT family protein [Erythrobacter ani]MBV7265618.1 GNAT family N-acetyltransferase [Erythrobacter ani]
MTDLVLESERLVLRKIGENDIELHDTVLNTPAVMAHLGGVMEWHEIEARHAKGMAMFARDGFSFLFAHEKSTGDMVAYCGIKWVENPLAPNVGDHEIGWVVREDRWRRGYAYEAMRAVIDWAFGPIGAPHVVALTCESNTGSWKLMEKLGMIRRKELDFIDPGMPEADNPTIQYSLRKEQWENR